MTDRRWDSESQEWIYASDVEAALDAARLAIDEYYDGDRIWDERWLVAALKATNTGDFSGDREDET